MTFYDPVNDVARGERAIVVVPEKVGEGSRRSSEARLEEAEGLAGAIGVEVVARKAFRLRQIRPATLLGKGQVEEVAEIARENDAKLLIVDAALTPVQQKSLEEEAGAKVIDRTGLILEIFGERAATAPGPTLSGSVAASAFSAVRAKRRSRRTAG